MNFTVSVIIPVRARTDYDVSQRIELKSKISRPKNFEFIIVDYGSDEVKSKEIEAVCIANNFKYLFFNSRGSAWNAAKARNIGIAESKTDFIIFEDADLLSHADFYHWINRQIISLLINNNWGFFSIPTAYLHEHSESTNNPEFLLTNECYDSLVAEINGGQECQIDFFAPVSSHLVCSREKAIEIGGYDESFDNWGLEDSDFWLRLLVSENIDKPRNFWKLDTRPYQQQVQWSGWRALMRIYGDLCALKGVYSFHIWHPTAEHRTPKNRSTNRKILAQNTEYYFKKNYTPIPLKDPSAGNTLFLNENPHSWNRALFKHFKNPILLSEDDLAPESLQETIHRLNIQEIIFNNPFGNPRRRELYEATKALGVPKYVVERGALPWSIYIDAGGFCSESASYQAFNWEKLEFSPADRAETLSYILKLRSGDESLEPQAERISGAKLRQKIFGANSVEKIIFFALQSPSDTTTNEFCGPIGSFEKFIEEIKNFANKAPRTWKILYKNHPLTISKISIENAFCVDDFNINDILEASDAVAMINSGVGVLSAAFFKPTYTFGQAFYSCPGLNWPVRNADELIKLISEEGQVDTEKAIKFIWYLRFKSYSFATWSREERSHTDLAKLSISKDINYFKLTIPGVNEYYFSNPIKINLKKSVLFDRYRLDDYINREDNPHNKNIRKNTTQKPSPPLISRNAGPKKILSTRKLNKLLRNPRQFWTDFIKNITH